MNLIIQTNIHNPFIHRALKKSTARAMAGEKQTDGSYENSLIANFELINLVPDDSSSTTTTSSSSSSQSQSYDNNRDQDSTNRILYHQLTDEDTLIRRRGPRKNDNKLTKWRRVGMISGRDVRLDTIVWPGGDIVVSGKWKLFVCLLSFVAGALLGGSVVSCRLT